MSEVIITPEMKEDAKKCASRNYKECISCGMYVIEGPQGAISDCVEALASLPEVWDDAPEWADCADVTFTDKNRTRKGHTQTYTRTLPKSLEDEIAEKYSFDTPSCHPMINGMRAIDVIKSALKEYNERQGK